MKPQKFTHMEWEAYWNDKGFVLVKEKPLRKKLKILIDLQKKLNKIYETKNRR